ETATTPLRPDQVAKSTSTSYIELRGEHATTVLAPAQRIFLFTIDRGGAHPPLLVWLTPHHGARRVTAIAQRGMAGFAISSAEIGEWKSKGVVTAGGRVVKTGLNSAPAITTAPPAFVPLPEQLRNTALQTLDGNSLKLSDFADKVVVLNIWATWCQPCRQEMPELVKISKEYQSRGLVVLGLATTYNERDDQQHVKDYIKAQNVPYHIICNE